MDWISVVVDFDNDILSEPIRKLQDNVDLPIPVKFCTAKDVEEVVKTQNVLCLILFASQYSSQLEKILLQFQEKLGWLPSHLLFVNDDPSPEFMVSVYEYGFEQFIAVENAGYAITQYLQRVWRNIQAKESMEMRIIQLNKAIHASEQNKIGELEKQLSAASEFDYVACYARAKALEAMGDYEGAEKVFCFCLNLHNFLRPAYMDLGEVWLVLGSVQDAIGIFENLEKANKNNLPRKVFLASAYLENKEPDKAKIQIEEAEQLSPGSSKVMEARALLYLSNGEFDEAMDLLENLHEVGPYFASKLNEVGVRLSQSGEGKKAIILYQKAHKVVRTELRYKISMNSALASKRIDEYEIALQYLERCKSEYGSSYPKLEKVLAAIQNEMKTKGRS